MRIGIDIGGTKTEIAVLSEDGEVRLRKRRPSPKNYQDCLINLQSMINETEAEVGPAVSIGICLPGAVSPDTGLIKNANTLYLNDRNVTADLKTLLGREIKLVNDADAFALSEATDGAAAGTRSCFAVIIGTGCGGGLVYQKQLITGPNAIAGEWGHNPLPYYSVEKDGPIQDCYCGRQNCIETFLSGTGMAKRYREKVNLDAKTIPDAHAVMARFAAGELSAIEHFQHYVNAMARALASVINIFDPEVVVLGGGMSNISELYEHLPEEISHYVFSDHLNTKIVPAQYGDSSGVRGAAWL
ncbi:transcriptional regulator [Endozoicomonas sp. OPT23]|uniref:ROK family protein n=1 Tax=Endozoicomonas sp. OPT23 TaxID=2072845 RepID=UPI00129B87E6|nr:ROK family protein [Endozoicomonas sp. OPT23]MRI31896.1 transcriptional regulator [Endozoicomonas sp. OPT23]